MTWEERYVPERTRKLLSTQSKIDHWHQVETAVVRARHDCGLVPENEFRELKTYLTQTWPTVGQVQAREAEIGHDVAAYVDVVLQGAPEGASRHFHRGLTSSDIVDTANSLIYKKVHGEIRTEIRELLAGINVFVKMFKHDERIGRTHGQWAAVTTLGHQFDVFGDMVHRTELSLETSYPQWGMINGPVGRGSDDVEIRAAELLGLWRIGRTGQMVPRDMLARWIQDLARLASVCEAIATHVRLSALSGIDEMHEGFPEGRKGSSSMPYKRNPILAERICGLARIVRSQQGVALENIATWFERDLTQSSAERIIASTAVGLTHGIVEMTVELLRNLVVDESRIEDNLEQGGRSRQHKLDDFEALLDDGVPRDEAYRRIQAGE